MDDKSSINLEVVTSLRNVAISRCGGVRTRGGRLPPVNLREITQMTGSKKVMVPNIPQRRKNIKKEIESPPVPLIKTENKDSQNPRGRGRGRQQRVFLQTEGSFLAEGPAAKIKKDPVRSEMYAVSSHSRKTNKNDFEAKVDNEMIKELLESYDANEAYDDDCDIKAPYRLPLLKGKIHGMKSEVSTDEIKKEIKQEFIVDTESGIKKEIKTEAEDDFKIGKEEASCKEQISFKIKNAAEEFQYPETDSGELLLLQLPRLTTPVDGETTEKSSKNKQSEKESEKKDAHVQKVSPVFTHNLEEGFIGKLKIMKSGKIKIVIGSAEFELIEGSPLDSYLEVAYLQVHKNEADIALLGKIRKRMILCPILSTFIPDVETDLSPRSS